LSGKNRPRLGTLQNRTPPSPPFKEGEIVYEASENHIKRESGGIAGIDIGLNNLATVTANKKDFQPFIRGLFRSGNGTLIPPRPQIPPNPP
jgi:hypothetical protein